VDEWSGDEQAATEHNKSEYVSAHYTYYIGMYTNFGRRLPTSYHESHVVTIRPA